MNRHFSVEWPDLTTEMQDEIREEVKLSILELVKEEGEKILAKEWHKPKPKTWQEAWIRDSYIEDLMWEAYIEGEEPRPKDDDWEYWLDEHLEEVAENRCYDAMHHYQLSVEI